MICNKLLEAALETARDLYGAGVMKKTTLRQIEELCLPPRRDFNSADIKRIRLSNNLSQGVFAAYLCVGVSTVQQWEQGHKKPIGSAARLLDVIDRKGLEALV